MEPIQNHHLFDALPTEELMNKILGWFAKDKDAMGLINEAMGKNKIWVDILEDYPELKSFQFFEYSQLILNELVREGYLEDKTKGVYKITLKGKLFNSAGGYVVQKARSEETKNLEDQKLRTEVMNHSNTLLDYDQNKARAKWAFRLSIIAIVLSAITLWLKCLGK